MATQQPQSLGIPDISGNTLEEIRASVQFWMQEVFNHLDRISGARGTPKYLRDIDANGKRITSLGAPTNDLDAQRVDHCLHSSGPGTDFNAQGAGILNVKDAEQMTQAPNLGQIKALQEASISAALPIGFIGIWYGSIASIPAGWALCDGNNGTPDLTDVFLMGAGSTYNPGDSGGAATINIAHTHSADGTLATDSDSTGPTGTETVDNDGAGLTVAVASSSHTHAHTHDVTGDTDSQLSATQSVLNPYKAYAFIMRIS